MFGIQVIHCIAHGARAIIAQGSNLDLQPADTQLTCCAAMFRGSCPCFPYCSFSSGGYFPANRSSLNPFRHGWRGRGPESHHPNVVPFVDVASSVLMIRANNDTLRRVVNSRGSGGSWRIYI